MADIHLIRPLLRAVARGELPARLVAQLGFEHLLAVCPHCRQEFAAWQAELASGRHQGQEAAATVSALADLESQVRWRAAERRRARRELQQLLKLSPKQRLEKVRRARRHFQSAALVKLLLEESARRRRHDAAAAYQIAELARLVAHRSPPIARSDLIALSTAHMGNARRAAGHLRDAEEYFACVRTLAREAGVVDPSVLAEIDHLEGSLRKDQRRFQLAEELLLRASLLYRLSGDKTGVARVLLTLGASHYQEGRPERALETTRSALQRLRRRSEPWLYLCGRHNLAWYLVAAGRHDEAAHLVAADEELYRRFADSWTQLRLLWIKGRIAAARGNHAAADKAFVGARDGFLAQGLGLDAAMVSLDLALLYLEHGHTVKLRRLAEEVATIFGAQDVHREAAAALVLFQNAARREVLTASMVREISEYLRVARTDPSLRFRDPAKLAPQT